MQLKLERIINAKRAPCSQEPRYSAAFNTRLQKRVHFYNSSLNPHSSSTLSPLGDSFFSHSLINRAPAHTTLSRDRDASMLDYYFYFSFFIQLVLINLSRVDVPLLASLSIFVFVIYGLVGHKTTCKRQKWMRIIL